MAPALVGAWKDATPKQAEAIINILARTSGQAIDSVAAVLHHENVQIREYAAKTLARSGPQASSALSQVARAATALGAMGPEASAALPVLHALLTDPNSSARSRPSRRSSR